MAVACLATNGMRVAAPRGAEPHPSYLVLEMGSSPSTQRNRGSTSGLLQQQEAAAVQAGSTAGGLRGELDSQDSTGTGPGTGVAGGRGSTSSSSSSSSLDQDQGEVPPLPPPPPHPHGLHRGRWHTRQPGGTGTGAFVTRGGGGGDDDNGSSFRSTTSDSTGPSSSHSRAHRVGGDHNNLTARDNTYSPRPMSLPTTPPTTTTTETANSNSNASVSLSLRADRRRRSGRRHRELNSVDVRCLRGCLDSLETFFDVSFDTNALIPDVQVLTCCRDQPVIEEGKPAKGIYIVKDGVLEMLFPGNTEVLCELHHGDFAGEVSTLSSIPCLASVYCKSMATVLHLPADSVTETIRGEAITREKLLEWCMKRAYVSSCRNSVFGATDFIQQMIVSCFKLSIVFSTWSEEALKFMSRLVTPILYSTGDTIYSRDEPACYVYFILKGVVECSREGDVVNSKSVKSSDDGYCLGSEEFFTEEVYKQSARAVGPLLTVPLDRSAILQTLMEYPTELHVGEVRWPT